MGSVVHAGCKCGYSSGSAIGGGIQDFETSCSFPCLCRKCRSMVGGNLLAKTDKCPECGKEGLIPYDDKSLRKKRGRRVISSWNMKEQLGRILILTDGDYYCPGCGEFSLRFEDSGICFD